MEENAHANSTYITIYIIFLFDFSRMVLDLFLALHFDPLLKHINWVAIKSLQHEWEIYFVYNGVSTIVTKVYQLFVRALPLVNIAETTDIFDFSKSIILLCLGFIGSEKWHG